MYLILGILKHMVLVDFVTLPTVWSNVHWGPANIIIYLIIMVVWQLHNQITYPNIHSSWRRNALPPLGEANEKFVDIALAHIKYTLSAWLVVVYFSKRFLAIELINEHKYSLYPSSMYSCSIDHIMEHEFCHLGCLAVSEKFLKRRNFCLSMLLFGLVFMG